MLIFLACSRIGRLRQSSGSLGCWGKLLALVPCSSCACSLFLTGLLPPSWRGMYHSWGQWKPGTPRVGGWNSSLRAPSKYFFPTWGPFKFHVPQTLLWFKMQFASFLPSLFVQCTSALISTSLHTYFSFTDDNCGFSSIRSPLLLSFLPSFSKLY